DAAAFAASIVRLIGDEELWRRIAQEGRAFITTVHSREAVFSRFISVLGKIMSGGLSSSIFCEELELTPSPDFDYELDRIVKQEALEKGKLKGFCNVLGSETEFIVSTDNFREGVVSTAS